MVKWLRKTAVREDEHHQAIIAEAVERLADIGSFEKDAVLEATKLTVFADAIRWDYIREFIDQDHGIELIPLAAVYFKRHHSGGKRDSRHGKEHPPESFPERYIAQGFGKKTAGFCIADKRNGHFVIKRLEQKRRKALGHAAKANEMLTRARDKGITGADAVPLLGNGK